MARELVGQVGVSICSAVEAMQSRCDGAQKLDGVGFNAYDADFFSNEWQVMSRSKGLLEKGMRRIAKYQRQLLELGIDPKWIAAAPEDVQVDDSGRLRVGVVEVSVSGTRPCHMRAIISQFPTVRPTVRASSNAAALRILVGELRNLKLTGTLRRVRLRGVSLTR